MLVCSCYLDCRKWELTENVADLTASQYIVGTSISEAQCQAACESNPSCNGFDLCKNKCSLSASVGPLSAVNGNHHWDLVDNCK